MLVIPEIILVKVALAIQRVLYGKRKCFFCSAFGKFSVPIYSSYLLPFGLNVYILEVIKILCYIFPSEEASNIKFLCSVEDLLDNNRVPFHSMDASGALLLLCFVDSQLGQVS